MHQEELAVVRRAYAMQMMAAARVDDRRVEAAFAATKREDFLGPGPWPIIDIWGTARGGTGCYVPTPSADPVYLYTDHVVGILTERNLNNGAPSLHARLLASADIKDGDHVVHVGTGTGYYTAIMAQLAGPSGRVTGIEVRPAARGAVARQHGLPRQCAGDRRRRRDQGVRDRRCHLRQCRHHPAGRGMARWVGQWRTADRAPDRQQGVHEQ